MSEETMDQINNELMEYLNEDQIGTIRKFMKITCRIEILEEFKNALKVTSASDKVANMINLFSNESSVLAIATIDEWIAELGKEADLLLNEVTEVMYTVYMIDYTQNLKKKFIEKLIKPELSKRVVDYFLDEKFGEGESSSKEAMKSICNESVQYFVNSFTSGAFDDITKDMKIE